MRFAILGNSGSGKSTLASWLARAASLSILDLDAVAWESGQPAVPRAADRAAADVSAHCRAHPCWVVEGCYADLIGVTLQFDPLFVFLNPGLEACRANCRGRSWESGKYESREAQDANLEFLLSWVADYYTRGGPMSLQDHQALFAGYPGRKVEFRRIPDLNPPDPDILALLR